MAGDRINFGINFDVGSAIKELGLVESALKSIANIAKGMGMEKYWKTQEQLVTELRKSYQDFLSVQSKDSATELIKTANALRAIAGIDITKSVSGLGDITEVIFRAEKLAPEIANSFSPENFRATFDTLSTLKKEGENVSDVITRLTASGDVSGLNRRLEEMSERLANAQNRASALEQELSDAKSANGIAELERRIEDLNYDLEISEERIRRVRREAESEFDNFLKGHNIQPDDFEFSSYYENLRDGTETAIEAISRFRVEYQHLFDQADQGNAALSVLDSFQAKIDGLIEEVASLSSSIRDMQLNGVKTSSDDASDSIQRLAEAMAAVNETSSSGSADGAQQNIASLVERINELAHVDIDSLQNVRGILLSIVNLDGIAVNASAVRNVSAILEAAKGFGTSGASFTLPDFSGLNGLNSVDGNKLKAIATYLPTIATADLEKLKALNEVDFSRLNGINVNQSVTSITALVNALRTTKLDQIKNFLNEVSFKKFTNIKLDETFNSFTRALTKLATVDTKNLKKLSEVSFQNLNAIDIRSTAAQSISSLANSLTQLSAAREELREIIEFVREYNSNPPGGGGSGGGGGPHLSEDFANVNGELVKVVETYDAASGAADKLISRTETLKEVNAEVAREAQLVWQVNPENDNQLELTRVRITENAEAAQKLGEKNEEAARRSNIAFNSLQRQVETYAESLRETVAEAEKYNVTSDDNVETVKNQEAATRQLLEEMRSADPSGLKGFETAFSNIQTSAHAAKIEVENTTAAMREQQKDSLDKGTTNYYKAVQKLESLKRKIIDDISRSSSAENGKSAADYSKLREYSQQVDVLYNKVKNGEIGNKEFAASFAELSNNAAASSNNIKSAGEMTVSFGEKIKKNLKNLTAYFTVSRAMMTMIRYIRDLIKTSVELDKEMTQLRIVTNETEQAYSDYSASIARTAREISSSMSDLISATTTFARLGYSLDESSVLAKYTAMLQQVGDIDAQAAQNAITAITKAFSDEVDINNIESVMDRLVIVGKMVAHICSNAYLVIGYNGQSRFGMIA